MYGQLYGSESWCLIENEKGILQGLRDHGLSNVWSTAQRWEAILEFDLDVGFD